MHTYLPTYAHTLPTLPTLLTLPTYLHTYIPTCIHTYILRDLQTYIPTDLETYIPTYLHAYIHTYIPTSVHTYLPTCIPTCMHIRDLPIPTGGLEGSEGRKMDGHYNRAQAAEHFIKTGHVSGEQLPSKEGIHCG